MNNEKIYYTKDEQSWRKAKDGKEWDNTHMLNREILTIDGKLIFVVRYNNEN